MSRAPTSLTSRRSKAGWHAEYFKNHPNYNGGGKLAGNDAYAGSKSSNKFKVYCYQCWSDCRERKLREDEEEVARGVRLSRRDENDIEDSLWLAKGKKGVKGWIASHISTLINHLATCELQPENVRTHASEDPHCTLTSTASPGAGHRRSTSSRHCQSSPLFAPEPGPSNLFGQSDTLYPPITVTPSPYFDSLTWTDNDIDTTMMTRPGTPIEESGSALSHSTMGPWDSASNIQSSRSASLNNRSSSLQALSSRQRSLSRGPPTPHWSASHQRSFETRLARFTASASLPLSWVDNPEWLSFVSEFIPGAKPPSQKVLTNRLIPELAKDLKKSAKAFAAGKEATLQADGWTGENHKHLIAFMITLNGKLYTVRVYDASTERKTTENLLKVMEDVIRELKEEWGVSVIAIVTDAAGESRKARKVYGTKNSSVVTLDCYSHQINLIVGDFIKSDSEILHYTDSATELITWLRSKTLLLAKICETQMRMTGSTQAVLRAVLTRWTAHYQAYHCHLMLRPFLRQLLIEEEMLDEAKKFMVIGDAKAKAKAKKMIDIINDSDFWHGLLHITRALRPLAIATNITQANFCRIDSVLITFASLVHQYSHGDYISEDPSIAIDTRATLARDSIIASIEKRWRNAQQEIFIAAIILNPFYRTRPFAKLNSRTTAGISDIMERLYSRLFNESIPISLGFNLDDYLGQTGMFEQMPRQCTIQEHQALTDKVSPDPVALWNRFCHPGSVDPPLIRLAKQILSISANSASCERLFSAFGTTLTKLRNRLGTKKLTDLTEIKMHIRDEHSRAKDKVQKRLKRHFVAPPPALNAALQTIHSQPVGSLNTEQISEPSVSSHGPDTITTENTDSTVTESGSQFSQGLRNFAERQAERANFEDDGENEYEEPEFVAYVKTPIKDLFILPPNEVPEWISSAMRSAHTSFDEELELYQMLDLDAEGEEDLDPDNVDIDEMAEEALSL